MIDIPIQKFDGSDGSRQSTNVDVLCTSARPSHIALQDGAGSQANRLNSDESDSVCGGSGHD